LGLLGDGVDSAHASGLAFLAAFAPGLVEGDEGGDEGDEDDADGDEGEVVSHDGDATEEIAAEGDGDDPDERRLELDLGLNEEVVVVVVFVAGEERVAVQNATSSPSRPSSPK
jgi:hypothetical protein